MFFFPLSINKPFHFYCTWNDWVYVIVVQCGLNDWSSSILKVFVFYNIRTLNLIWVQRVLKNILYTILDFQRWFNLFLFFLIKLWSFNFYNFILLLLYLAFILLISYKWFFTFCFFKAHGMLWFSSYLSFYISLRQNILNLAHYSFKFWLQCYFPWRQLNYRSSFWLFRS